MRTILIFLFLASTMCALPMEGHAATPRHSRIEVESEHYWETHYICLARVEEITPMSAVAPRQITFSVIREFAVKGAPTKLAVPISHLWFGVYGGESPPLEKGDVLVVSFAVEERGVIVSVKIDEEVDQSLFVKKLERIASVRDAQDKEAMLLKMLAADDASVIQFCLNRLSATGVTKDNKPLVAALNKLLENKSASGEARLTAHRLLEKAGALRMEANEYVAWLKTSVRDSRGVEYGLLRPLIEELVGSTITRNDLVMFLSSTILDSQYSSDARLAATSAAVKQPSYDFDSPDDPVSKRIFATVVLMLRDPEPIIRKSGSAMLHTICEKIPDIAKRTEYLKLAVAAVEAALDVEKDKDVANYMRAFLQHLEGIKIEK